MQPTSAAIVADNTDTLILNVKLRQDYSLDLAQQLDVFEASQEAEEGIVTDLVYAGERLFIKPYGVVAAVLAPGLVT